MKKVLSIVIAAVVIGLGVGMYMWNKPHKDIQSAKSEIQIDAKTLFQEFDADETAAGTKYLDKLVEVKGTVRSVDMPDEGVKKVILDSSDEMFGIICELDPLSTPKRTTFKIGEQVTFKGMCTGKLFDVVLARCVEL